VFSILLSTIVTCYFVMSDVVPKGTRTGEVSTSTNATVEDVSSTTEKETQRAIARIGLIMEDFQQGDVKGFTALSAVVNKYDSVTSVSDEEKEKSLRPLIEEIYASSAQPIAKAIGPSLSRKPVGEKQSPAKQSNNEITDFFKQVTHIRKMDHVSRVT